MPDASIVVQHPAAAEQLVLLFHGVGSSAANMVPIGEAIAGARTGAVVVSVDGPKPSTLGSGREWFSVVGVTEDNRPARIAEVMPLFLETVARWQNEFRVGPEHTAVVGFSQGSIMALEATQAGLPASRVVALAGRFAEPVRRVPMGLKFHLIHGDQDGVVPACWAIDAQRQLQSHGANVTLDLLPDLGHGIDARALELAIGYLLEGAAVIAPDLVLADSEYLLRFAGDRGQMASASFRGGAAALMGSGLPVQEASLERAIEVAEDWLMPHAAKLRDMVLEISDPSGRFAGDLKAVLAVTTREWTVAEVESMLLHVVDMATGPGSANLQSHREFVADLLVIRELAHHGRVSAVRLK